MSTGGAPPDSNTVRLDRSYERRVSWSVGARAADDQQEVRSRADHRPDVVGVQSVGVRLNAHGPFHVRKTHPVPSAMHEGKASSDLSCPQPGDDAFELASTAATKVLHWHRRCATHTFGHSRVPPV